MGAPELTGVGTHVATERGYAVDLIEPGEPVPAGTPIGLWMKPADPLDHDGDGHKGGSVPGEESTAAKGRRRRAAGGE